MSQTVYPVVGPALPQRGNRLTTWLAQNCLRACGWRVDGAMPDVPKLVIIVAPHTTNWDFVLGVAVIFALRFRVRFLAKHTLFRRPLGAMMRWFGGMPVDRSQPHGLVSQVVEDFRRFDKLALAITPEGTRKAVSKWHEGFYYIALGAKVPIVPVTFDARRRVVDIGKALQPSGDAQTDIARLQAFCTGGLRRTQSPASAQQVN
jgi:1-acyl-sn-glycerol-3-phosphate acyltransferase